MSKNFGNKPILAPLPVMVVGSYDENGIPNAMTVSWGGQCGHHQICLALSKHKSTENIRARQAFTVHVADLGHLVIADYFGVAKGKDENKIEKAGVHTHPGDCVDAPVIEEFPLVMECRVISITEEFGETRVVGEVINTRADERILDEAGNVSLTKLRPISYDSTVHDYRVLGEKVGRAFHDGLALK